VIRSFSGAEEGQALVVVGAAMFVLLGALMLTLDWGYGLAMRRAMQNESDGAVLAAGRLLATNFGGTDFALITQEAAWCTARTVTLADRPGHPTTTDETVEISFSSDGSAFTTPITDVADCLSILNPHDIPASTRYVRVRARASYDSLIGVLGRQRVEAAATSRAQLGAAAVIRPQRPMGVPVPPPPGYRPYGTPGSGVSGWWTAPNAAMWPVAVRYRDTSGALLWSDPSRLVQIFGAGGGGSDDNFFVTLAHFSARDSAHQLVTESDFSGTANIHHFDHGTAPLVNSSPGTCANPSGWDTNGGLDSDGPACDIPNWLNYGFRGSVSVGTDWGDRSWNVFRCDASPCPEPAPQLTPATTRSSCTTLPSWVTSGGGPGWFAPSCATGAPVTMGDWLETVPLGSLSLGAAHDRMIWFIQTYGRGEPGDKSVVVNVFVWDCAQQFGPPWAIALASGDPDCSMVNAGSSGPGGPVRLDRLHVLAIVPMTVNENDVRINGGGNQLRVNAHWGGIFGDAGSCSSTTPPGCPLNPLMNSAFLVPDE
jgi:hypothetical protein